MRPLTGEEWRYNLLVGSGIGLMICAVIYLWPITLVALGPLFAAAVVVCPLVR